MEFDDKRRLSLFGFADGMGHVDHFLEADSEIINVMVFYILKIPKQKITIIILAIS